LPDETPLYREAAHVPEMIILLFRGAKRSFLCGDA
jgi:hypothetical protein